jgi:carboxyl-terminal processing protease
MRKKILTLLLCFGGAVSAQPGIGTHNGLFSNTTKEACIVNASRLLEEVFGLMEKNYYRKDIIPWDSLHQQARLKVQSSSSCEAAYDAISWCFGQMKESHSFIMPAVKAAAYNNDTSFLRFRQDWSDQVGEMRAEIPEAGTGYLTLPWVNTTDEALCRKIADSAQQLIARLDQQGVTQWIIDLRRNTGGNCWPMLAGVGPLLGNGVCGYFVRNQESVPFSYENGKALQGKHVRCAVSGAGYTLLNPPRKIILLTGPRTSSSGEIVALAFKGLPNVVSVGQPTAGLTTANATYTLSNNAMLVLTVCQEADRTGKIWSGRLQPDVWVDYHNAHEPDKARLKALQLLADK